jgi:heme oxygenase
MNIAVTPTEDLSRAKKLKAATHEAHEGLDNRIMTSAPFQDKTRYGLFVQVQYHFHRDLDALYGKPELAALLPNLAELRRLPAIEQDLRDLGLSVPAAKAPAAADADTAAALGWLYVAEGSNLGAAFLLKEAAKLGLDESNGARHLAAHPEGRGLAWKRFTAALDAAELSPDQEAAVIAGANAAFTRVRALVEEIM